MIFHYSACLLVEHGMSQKGALFGFLLTLRILGFCMAECLLEKSQTSHEFQHHKMLTLNCRTMGKCKTKRGQPDTKARTLGKRWFAREAE